MSEEVVEVVVVPKKRGRPAGSKDKAPRQRKQKVEAEEAPVETPEIPESPVEIPEIPEEETTAEEVIPARRRVCATPRIKQRRAPPEPPRRVSYAPEEHDEPEYCDVAQTLCREPRRVHYDQPQRVSYVRARPQVVQDNPYAGWFS